MNYRTAISTNFPTHQEVSPDLVEQLLLSSDLLLLLLDTDIGSVEIISGFDISMGELGLGQG